MSFGLTYEVPGTPEIYFQVRRLLGDDLPTGLVSHVVTNSPGGLRHTDVWETEEDWRAFNDGPLAAALGKVLGDLGITPEPPVVELLDVVDTWVGATRVTS